MKEMGKRVFHHSLRQAQALREGAEGAEGSVQPWDGDLMIQGWLRGCDPGATLHHRRHLPSGGPLPSLSFRG